MSKRGAFRQNIYNPFDQPEYGVGRNRKIEVQKPVSILTVMRWVPLKQAARFDQIWKLCGKG